MLNTCVYWKSKDDPDTSLEDSLPDNMSTSDVPTKYVDGAEYVSLHLLCLCVVVSSPSVTSVVSQR